MTTTTQPLRCFRFGLQLSALLIALFSFAPMVAAEVGEEDKASWQAEYTELINRVRDAEQRVEASKGAKSKARQRQRLQGKYKEEVMGDIEQAEADLVTSRAELDAFPEKARRAGVPPGWLREVEMEMEL